MTHKIMIIGVVLAFFGLTAYSQSDTTVQHKDSLHVFSKQELTETITKLLKDENALDNSNLLFRERELRRLIIMKRLMQFDMMKSRPMMNNYVGVSQNTAPPVTPVSGYDPNVNIRLNNIEHQLQQVTNLLTNLRAYQVYKDSMQYVNIQRGYANNNAAATQYQQVVKVDTLRRYVYKDIVVHQDTDPQKENMHEDKSAQQARDAELSAQMEALRQAVNNSKSGSEGVTGKDAALLAMLTTLMAQNKDLKNQIEKINAAPAPAPTIIPAPVPVNRPANTPRFTGEVKKVFFANNSDKIDAKAFETIKAVVQQLKNTSGLQVMIKGFASQVGNSAYNQILSQRRTDAVKSAIMREGIDPGLVLSSYHGEDVSPNHNESYARRVEILFIQSHIK